MTQETIKEKLALYHFSLLASRQGCKLVHYNYDDGTDLGIDRPEIANIFGMKYHFSAGQVLEFQFKTTTEHRIIREAEHLKYDLDVRAYNKLIYRRESRYASQNRVPYLLMLMVIPTEPDEWISHNTEAGETLAKGHFYWYFPDAELTFSKNSDWQRIKIPLKNKVDLSFFEEVFNLQF